MSTGSAPRRHIFHLLPRLIEDGTTHMVATLLKGMDRGRYRLTVCGLSPDDADLGALRALADDVHVLDQRRFFDPRAVVSLYALLKDSQVDVLHTHRIRPDIVGRIAGALAGIPVNISTQHYVEEWSERGPVVHRLSRALFAGTMGLCQSVACNSAAEQGAMLAQIGERYRHKTCVVHNGLDTDRFTRPAGPELTRLRESLALPAAARPISVVAYLTERKGHRYLLDAVAQLRTSVPDLVLLVVGDGPLRADLAGRAESLGIPDRVRFLGARSDIPGILALSEVAVLPSLWEPFGLAALEAMAVETPVVVTRTGGLPEFVTQGENGCLVPPADAAALAHSIGELLRDREAARRMGRAGRSTVMNRFTARHVAAAYQELYEHHLGGADRQSA